VRIWGTQTAEFQREIDRLRNQPAAGSAAVAADFRSLGDNSPSFVRQHRLDIIYGRGRQPAGGVRPSDYKTSLSSACTYFRFTIEA
jgi:hypothetical protein